MSKIVNLIYKGCLYFVILFFVFMIVPIIPEVAGNQITEVINNRAMPLVFSFVLFLYGQFLSFSSLIFRIPVNKVLQFCIHFIANLAFFYFDVINLSGVFKNNQRSAIIGVIGYIVLYIIFSFAAWGIRSLIHASKKKDESYAQKFKK